MPAMILAELPTYDFKAGDIVAEKSICYYAALACKPPRPWLNFNSLKWLL